MQTYWSIYKHREMHVTYANTHTNFHILYLSKQRENSSQKAKTGRKMGGKTERLSAEGRLGAFPLALTGEINHHNYRLAQVNGDRSPLSFSSSRCFLLIRASQALLPADPWPMRSKCALDACEMLGTSRELVLHIAAGILMLTRC